MINKDYKQIIINAIKSHELSMLNLNEVAKLLNCARITAERKLNEMVIEGILTRKTYKKDESSDYHYTWWKMAQGNETDAKEESDERIDRQEN